MDLQTDKTPAFGQTAIHLLTKKVIANQEIRFCAGLELLKINFSHFLVSERRWIRSQCQSGELPNTDERSFVAIRFISPRIGRLFSQARWAPPHCSSAALEFLDEKLPNYVITLRSQRCWPARSPDLNTLDFFVWGDLDSKLAENNPATIENAKIIVEEEVVMYLQKHCDIFA